MIQQHYVTFLSPGTFMSESNTEEISSWDVEKASNMARSILQRHNAKPYGFYFTTRGREDSELDSKQIARSPMYYLGGVVETYEEVCARNDPNEDILRFNMKCNEWNRIITNTNSWRITLPLNDDDVVLDWSPQ